MTHKQRTILKLLAEGKEYFEICERLKINASNLHSTIYQMRKNGMIVSKVKHIAPPLSPKQREVLTLYSQNIPVPEIAKRLQISCMTVMNHATAGFHRLGLTTPGLDRVAALRGILASPSGAVAPTMEDPFFN